MIRFVIIALVLFILFIIYMHIRDEHYTREQRQRVIRLGLVTLASLSIMIVAIEYLRRWQLSEDLIAAQFEQTSDNFYTTSIGTTQITVRYESGYEPEQSVPRLVFKVSFDKPFREPESLFCDKTEFERYQAFNYGRLYPTPEIKLPNGHFVGKCYPRSMVEEIAKMTERQHDFVPRHARYLFLPSVNDEEHTVYFYTENLDVTTLRDRLTELLDYYKRVARY